MKAGQDLFQFAASKDSGPGPAAPVRIIRSYRLNVAAMLF